MFFAENQSMLCTFFQIPVLAVEIAMDHKPSHREMTSVLISDLYGRIVTQKDIGRGWFQFLCM
jgi:programmed cell death protein 4